MFTQGIWQGCRTGGLGVYPKAHGLDTKGPTPMQLSGFQDRVGGTYVSRRGSFASIGLGCVCHLQA